MANWPLLSLLTWLPILGGALLQLMGNVRPLVSPEEYD